MLPPEGRKSDRIAEAGWRRGFLLRMLPLAAVLSIGFTVALFGAGKLFSLEAVMRHLMAAQDFTSRNGASFLILFAMVYTIAVAFSLPVALPLTVSGGFLFGWIPGALIGIGAKTLGSLMLFLIARYGFADLASRHAGPRLAAIEEKIRSDSFCYTLFLRLQPVVPFFLVNIAAALFEVRTRVFVLATAIGIAPGAFISSFTGFGLGDIVERNRPFFDLCMRDDVVACERILSLASLWSPKAFLALVLLALLALVPVALAWGRRAGLSGRRAGKAG